MSVSNFLTSIGAGEVMGKAGIGLLILLTLLQIMPIKINPWSWIWKQIGKMLRCLGKRIGNSINGEVITELKEIKLRVIDLEKHDERQDATRALDKALDARRRILRFADEVRRKDKHSQEHFNNIFDDIKDYNAYCKEHSDFANDRARLSIKRIEEVYEECDRNNSFL